VSSTGLISQESSTTHASYFPLHGEDTLHLQLSPVLSELVMVMWALIQGNTCVLAYLKETLKPSWPPFDQARVLSTEVQKALAFLN